MNKRKRRVFGAGFGLTKEELAVLRPLSSPIRIQDFLDTLPINHEKHGRTNRSPRGVLRTKKAHCMEGALLAALALWLHGQEPLLMDLKSVHGDDDHVVALYKKNGYWGAISKTNHATLRFRDPIYRTLRELALSYFHEYFVNRNGKKTLRSYAGPFNLKRFGRFWVTAPGDLWFLAEAIDTIRHVPLVPKKNRAFLRLADTMEREAGQRIEWQRKHPRT